MRLTGSGPFVDRLQAHLCHQLPDAMTANGRSFSSQISCDLAATEERIFGEHAVDLFHQRQRVRIDADRRVVEGRS